MKIDGARLAAELVRKRLTQKELAEKAGISRATVSYIKSGKSCSNVVGQAIANALGVELSELIEEGE